MKITFILPYAGLAGGIRVVAIYAERLKNLGHDVTVVSLPKRPLTVKQRVKTLLKKRKWLLQNHSPSHFDNVDVKHIILEKNRPITNDDVPDADVVIATWWETAEWVNRFQLSKGTKFYFVQHHETHMYLPIERVKATYSLPLHKITIARWLVDIMAENYGDNDVALVPNSVDHHFFNTPERSKQSIPTVGFMYARDDFKGCDITISALNEIKESLDNLKILSFGSHLPSTSLPLPPNTDFHYQPTQEKIRELYSSCDFWLFGSRTEGFGLPILEAMACRTPVIATKAGAAPELITKGGGILVDDWSPKTMATSIMRSFSIPEEKWLLMSQTARTTSSGYTWDDATLLLEKAISCSKL